MNFNLNNLYLKKFQNVDKKDFFQIHDSNSPFTLEFPTSHIQNKAVISIVSVTGHEQHPYLKLVAKSNEMIDGYKFTFDINNQTINLDNVSIQYRCTKKKQRYIEQTFEANTATLKVEIYDKDGKLVETKFSDPIRNLNFDVSEDATISSVEPENRSSTDFIIHLKHPIPYFSHEVFVKITDTEFSISSEDDFPIKTLLLEVLKGIKPMPDGSNMEIIFRIYSPEKSHEGNNNAPTIEERKKKKFPVIVATETQITTLLSENTAPETNGHASLECENCTTIVPIPETNEREVCLVISNTYFGKQDPREIGKGKDEERIREVFTNKLFYKVIILPDKKTEILIAEINEIIKINIKRYHQNVVVFVLSHGDNGVFCTHDGSMNIEDLVGLFLPTNCPALSDQPKIFFFSCCRGNKENGISFQDSQVVGSTTCDKGPENALQSQLIRSTPSYHNVFKGFSTPPGYSSKRGENGTVYIQELLNVIEKKPEREVRRIHDILQTRMFKMVTKEHNHLIPEASNSLVRDAYFKHFNTSQ